MSYPPQHLPIILRVHMNSLMFTASPLCQSEHDQIAASPNSLLHIYASSHRAPCETNVRLSSPDLELWINHQGPTSGIGQNQCVVNGDLAPKNGMLGRVPLEQVVLLRKGLSAWSSLQKGNEYLSLASSFSCLLYHWEVVVPSLPAA